MRLARRGLLAAAVLLVAGCAQLPGFKPATPASLALSPVPDRSIARDLSAYFDK